MSDPRDHGSPPCPCCAGEHSTPWLERGGLRYLRCAGCGHGWLDPLPEPGTLREIFGKEYFEGGREGGYFRYELDESGHRKTARRRLAFLRSLGLRPPGEMIEIGPAYGFFLEEAWLQGWRVHGVELSDHARAKAALRAPGYLVASPEELPGRLRGACQAVLLFQVLAHLREPERMLAEIRPFLAPRGVLVCETWNAESSIARLFGRMWQQVSPPAVQHLFGERSLREILRRTGFKLRSFKPWGKTVSLSFALGTAAGRLGWTSLGARLADSPLRRIPIPYGFGDLVVAVAEPDSPKSAS